jgi:hypothetical protein
MESRVLKALKEYGDILTSGSLRVSGTQIQWIGNDGSMFYLSLQTPLIDLLQHGGSSSASIRTRS